MSVAMTKQERNCGWTFQAINLFADHKCHSQQHTLEAAEEGEVPFILFVWEQFPNQAAALHLKGLLVEMLMQ